MPKTIGFIAYAGDPSEIGQSIEAAARAHNQRFGPDTLCTWRENDIAGRFLAGPILDNIRDSKCLIADVSVLNQRHLRNRLRDWARTKGLPYKEPKPQGR